MGLFFSGLHHNPTGGIYLRRRAPSPSLWLVVLSHGLAGRQLPASLFRLRHPWGALIKPEWPLLGCLLPQNLPPLSPCWLPAPHSVAQWLHMALSPLAMAADPEWLREVITFRVLLLRVQLHLLKGEKPPSPFSVCSSLGHSTGQFCVPSSVH